MFNALKISARRFMISLFVLIAAVSFGANTFIAPDFAFPQTVEKNAREVFRKAMSRRDGQEALQAAIQISVASTLVSNDSYPKAIAALDSVARLCPMPYSNLACLCEARLYKEIYNADRYVYDQRQIPPLPVPENVMEWNRLMFADKVLALVTEANSYAPALANMSIADIKSLLVDASDARAAGFSVADFISLQTVELLSSFDNNNRNVIPFGTSVKADGVKRQGSSEIIDNAIDAAISRHASDSNLTAEVFFCDLKVRQAPYAGREALVRQYYEQFKDSPYGASFVADYVSNIKNRNEKYDILTQYLKKFPSAPQIGLVESAINNLSTQSVNLDFNNRMLPHRESKIKVSGANLYNFYILAYKLGGKDTEKRVTYAQLSALKPVSHINVKIDSVTPAAFDTVVSMPGLAPGIYTFVASSTPYSTGILLKNSKSQVSKVLVGNLSVFCTSSSSSTKRNLYVVSSINQAPVKGAKVTLYPYKNGKKGTPVIKMTDADGRIELDNAQYYYSAASNGNFVDGMVYGTYVSDSRNNKVINANVLTNLSIYHPGDTLKFDAVVYSAEKNDLRVVADREFKAILVDANYQGVDTLNIVTDKFGRAASEFSIPNSGLLGNWQVRIVDDRNWLGGTSVQVADYKSPTFFVAFDSDKDTGNAGGRLTFTGRALTYAGMPVADAKVEYTVKYVPQWWRAAASSGSYGGQTETDADGRFSIVLDTDNLKDTPYANGAFRLSASITNAAGETQASEPLTFSIGSDMYIDARMPELINADKADASFQVVVNDIAGIPVVKKVYYRAKAANKTILSGEFDSPVLKLDLAKLASGRYAFDFSLNQDFKSDANSRITTDSVTIWRSDDKIPPVVTPLWVPVKQINAPAGAGSVKIKVGSSYPDSYLFALVSNTEGVVAGKWLKLNNGIIEVPVDVPADNMRLFVHLIGERNLDRKDYTVTIVPHVQTTKLKVAALTFRDRVAPGARESWKFRFCLDGKPCPDIAVAAVMTNKALNAISPFSWQFDPSANRYWSNAGRYNFTNRYDVSNNVTLPVRMKVKTVKYFTEPLLNTYGQSLFQHGIRIRGTRSYASKAAAGTLMANEVVNEVKDMAVMNKESAVEEEVAVVESDVFMAPTSMPMVNGSDADTESITLRRVDMAEAFFFPNLATDAAGVATVDFTAPDFVGTWQFQILGYTPGMKGATMCLDAVAARKVMAQMNAPRFVRSGDMASFAATVYNNSAEAALVGSVIELLNPVDGKVLLRKVFDDELTAASASRTVSAELFIPADITAILIRVYGSIAESRDGEQTIIPVLPSSTPVVESTPFYIGSGKTDFEIKLPKFDKNAIITLTYCDNPVWECVTALPDMLTPKSVNILSKAYALYGNAVSASLFNKYPSLLNGIRKLAADSALVSPLSRNPELKTVLLNNTPWVNSASAETLRMQNLLEFADKDKSATAVADMMKAISDAQQSDGGWSWCPDMKTSDYITARVVHVLAALANMDCLPKEGHKVARKAFMYLDNQYADDWNKSKRKNLPVVDLLNYLTDKSAFSGVESTSQFAPLDAAAIKAIVKDWRDFGIGDKATAAILLERRGDKKLSRTLLESIKQFASVSPDKGMWFDNLNSSGWGSSPLLTTARVLEAYNLIEPQAPEVEQLRQWLVVSKQTQNWGDERCTAAAVHAVLTSGLKPIPTVENETPQITLAGTPLDFSANSVTGSLTINLDPGQASGARLKVERSGNGPAWGGVVAQYVAPILDVRQAKTPQISIAKNVYVIKNDSTGSTASAGSYAVGDKVRVTLTIITDRELDYVAVTDPRAACLEPVVQLSGYTSSDGVWYYCEVRDAQTNLFIPYLSKGTHLISYECTIDRAGSYSLGVANAQSQYAPTITAHSAGQLIISK